MSKVIKQTKLDPEVVKKGLIKRLYKLRLWKIAALALILSLGLYIVDGSWHPLIYVGAGVGFFIVFGALAYIMVQKTANILAQRVAGAEITLIFEENSIQLKVPTNPPQKQELFWDSISSVENTEEKLILISEGLFAMHIEFDKATTDAKEIDRMLTWCKSHDKL
ncbi:MAG: hypothetical protein MK212_01485 [Saprospiraceae bacterium]|nr:hypothetical protein [Saprospiraceae bacterium]